MDGKIVQLKQGKDKVIELTDFESVIKQFKCFPEVNVIDLDAAMTKGIKNNRELVKDLCKKLNCNVGGGIRTNELAFEYLRAGAKNVIIGTKAVNGNDSKKFLKQLPASRTIVSLDVKDRRITIEGWQEFDESNVSLEDQMKELEGYCSRFLVTNVNVEGMNQGTDLDFIKSLQSVTSNKIIVAGGISSYDEIKKINQLGFDQVLGMAVYTGKIDLRNALIEVLNFNKQECGLITTVAKDVDGQILMVANSNKESVFMTLETGNVHYFSRSRNKLWKKGETSGCIQHLVDFNYDCDADTLVYTVDQEGVACHKGTYTCFGDKKFSLNYFKDYLSGRLKEGNKSSYTVKVCSNNEKLYKKIIEEAFEVTQAKDKEDQVWEVADLIYFVIAYMAKNNLNWSEILNELWLRHGDKLVEC